MDETINSKIDAIKLIRAFTTLDMRKAKIVTEAWEVAFCNNFQTSNLRELLALGDMARMVDNGEWIINEKEEIVIKKVIGTSDIRNLRG